MRFKNQIAPDFDRFIKFALDILDVAGLPSRMPHVSNEDSLFIALKDHSFPSFCKYYENNGDGDFFVHIRESLVKTEGGQGALKGLQELWTNLDELWRGVSQGRGDVEARICTMFLADLDDESIIYYLRFRISQDKISGLDNHTRDEIAKYQISNILSLCLHRIIAELEKYRDTIKELSPEYIQVIMFSIWNIVSLCVNDRPLGSLYRDAKQGDDEALCKIAVIDKSLVDHEWARDRIREALYCGDGDFFRRLGNAIGQSPLKGKRTRIVEFLVLTLLWEVGLYRLGIKEMLDLFQKCGLALKEEEVTFRKFVDRFKKKRPKLLPFSHYY